MTVVEVVIRVDNCATPRVIVHTALDAGALAFLYFASIVRNNDGYGD